MFESYEVLWTRVQKYYRDRVFYRQDTAGHYKQERGSFLTPDLKIFRFGKDMLATNSTL